MKTERQNEIIRLISSRDIGTQDELAAALRESGYQVTQATVSRDIRELRLTKTPAQGGGYRYARREKRELAVSERLTRILKDSVIQVDFSGQTVVVKTLSGSANVAAEAIDTLGWPEILGTIAGDNTIFIVVRDPEDAGDVTRRIRGLTELS